MMFEELISEISIFLRSLERCQLIELSALSIIATPHKSPVFTILERLEPLLVVILNAVKECRTRLEELVREKPAEIRNVITRLVRTKGEEKDYSVSRHDNEDSCSSSSGSNLDMTIENIIRVTEDEPDVLLAVEEQQVDDPDPIEWIELKGSAENVPVSASDDSLTFFIQQQQENQVTAIENPVLIKPSIPSLVSEESSKILCPICKRPQKSARSLRRHVTLLHNHKEPYRCTFCNKEFARAMKLKRHLSVHGPPSHYCSECGEGFARADTLKRHTNIAHRGLKPYSCELCHKKFGFKGNLKEHMAAVHGGPEETKTCPTCNKQLKNGATFRHHMRLHRPPCYSCILCNRSYFRRHDFRTHMSKMHPGSKAIQKLFDAVRVTESSD